MVWSGAFPILIGLAAVAFATHSMCKNQDKRTTQYQVAIAVIFLGVLCAFCGIVMMGSGMGINLFGVGGAARAGYGGGYGMY
jgi:hypothetical protein